MKTITLKHTWISEQRNDLLTKWAETLREDDSLRSSSAELYAHYVKTIKEWGFPAATITQWGEWMGLRYKKARIAGRFYYCGLGLPLDNIPI